MFHFSDPNLKKTLKKDKVLLEKTQLPIITVSATYREDLKGLHGLAENDQLPDIVFSRAHYSMALGVAMQAWGKNIDPEKAWLVDPTNYVDNAHWSTVTSTALIGQILARFPILKQAKDLIDKFARQKLPLLDSITPPLLYLTKNIQRPILSFHIAAGNILATHGKQVVQVITDPHVREDYLVNAELSNLKFCVFDEKTKTDFLEKAAILGKKIEANKVIVTGPPIDPRIVAAAKNKIPWKKNPLKLCLTTGGLGTNKAEIATLLKQLLPTLKTDQAPYKLMLYAGIHRDIRDLALRLAKEQQIEVFTPQLTDPAPFILESTLTQQAQHNTQAQIKQTARELTQLKQQQKSALLTILYHPQIVDANELLIKFAFPWADGFVSKPSGDMAYDAVAAGCFLLTLAEWGEWEHNIRQIFEEKNICRKAKITDINAQLESLKSIGQDRLSWINKAMRNALDIEKLFLRGAKKLIEVTKN